LALLAERYSRAPFDADDPFFTDVINFWWLTAIDG
jgi:hypothetical protein